MAADDIRFRKEFREKCAKGLYLTRKFQSLASLNKWVETEYSDRNTDFLGVRISIASCCSNNEIDKEVYRSMGRNVVVLFKDQFKLPAEINKKFQPVLEGTPPEVIDAQLRKSEHDVLEIVNQARDKTDKIIGELQKEAELSLRRDKALLLLLLNREDYYEMIDCFLHDVRAYRAREMKKIHKNQNLQRSSALKLQYISKGLPLEVVNTYFIVCSRLSSLEDAFDSLLTATSRNIQKLQDNTRKLLLVQLAEKDYELLTLIVEAELDLRGNAENFREDRENEVYSLANFLKNHPESDKAINTSLSSYFQKKMVSADKEKRKVNTFHQIVREQDNNCPGMDIAEKYVLLLTKEHCAKVDAVLRQIALFENVLLGDYLVWKKWKDTESSLKLPELTFPDFILEPSILMQQFRESVQIE
ncbi:uncharacterized protein LOC109833625 isoform X1 [Asparagus officinalis]|uniref:uncharacterized protein LOC109833625 isoform X1 n=1 Tax=Asparagus officinalis TaxID=4686 RepID=UPI00098E1666|nr:uncharacterized protein LOC109833625 isoform X1 [Asparagus officinalis]XP_020256956.1 uncharacterized protein LOC109833625 isoform X1 [Asparagus officinalis]